MSELTIDREFEELCPPLSEEETALLEAGLQADGCRDPIITWANHDGTILDGHNRYRLCNKLGIPFKTKALWFENREAATSWVLRNQLGRRNLRESQRAMLAAKLANLSQGESKPANLPVSTQAEAAAAFGVSERTVRSAKKVLDTGSKELKKAVESGTVSVAAAAKVAELPKAQQKKIVAKGPDAVKAVAKEIKQYKDDFDPAKLTKELAKDKKPGTAKKQWNDKTAADEFGKVAKQIDAMYAGVLTVFDECWETVGGQGPDFERAKRAVHTAKTRSHDALSGVTAAFRLWRPAT